MMQSMIELDQVSQRCNAALADWQGGVLATWFPGGVQRKYRGGNLVALQSLDRGVGWHTSSDTLRGMTGGGCAGAPCWIARGRRYTPDAARHVARRGARPFHPQVGSRRGSRRRHLCRDAVLRPDLLQQLIREMSPPGVGARDATGPAFVQIVLAALRWLASSSLKRR